MTLEFGERELIQQLRLVQLQPDVLGAHPEFEECRLRDQHASTLPRGLTGPVTPQSSHILQSLMHFRRVPGSALIDRHVRWWAGGQVRQICKGDRDDRPTRSNAFCHRRICREPPTTMPLLAAS